MVILFNKANTKRASDNPEKPQDSIYDKLRRILNNKVIFNFWAILAYAFVILTIYYALKLEGNSTDMAFGSTFFASLFFSIGLSRHGPGYTMKFRVLLRYLTIGLSLPLLLLPVFTLIDIQKMVLEGREIGDVILVDTILISSIAAIIFFSTVHRILAEDVKKIRYKRIDDETTIKRTIIQIGFLVVIAWIAYLSFLFLLVGVVMFYTLIVYYGEKYYRELKDLKIPKVSIRMLLLFKLTLTLLATLLFVLIADNPVKYLGEEPWFYDSLTYWPLFAASYTIFLSLSHKLWLNIPLRLAVFFSFYLSLNFIQGLFQAN